MAITELDFIFPFVVFGYGAAMLFVFTTPRLARLAEEKLPSELWHQFQSRRIFAIICFVVGGLWSMQNLWLR